MFDKPKMLTGLNQKVCGQVVGPQRSSHANDAPPAERHDLTCFGTDGERGKPVGPPTGNSRQAKREQRCRTSGQRRREQANANL
jgi:hypothetical protein